MAIHALVLDCSPLERPDCSTIERIARLQLAVQRCGLELRLRNPNHPLLELIDLAGLAGVLLVEAGWQPEEREKRCCVQEESELDDPSA
jgi:anti-anti-sigma regulatory factor